MSVGGNLDPSNELSPPNKCGRLPNELSLNELSLNELSSNELSSNELFCLGGILPSELSSKELCLSAGGGLSNEFLCLVATGEALSHC